MLHKFDGGSDHLRKISQHHRLLKVQVGYLTFHKTEERMEQTIRVIKMCVGQHLPYSVSGIARPNNLIL